MSPQIADSEEANRLSAIPEESLNAQPGDVLPQDLNTVNDLPTDVPAPVPSEAAAPGWIAENDQLTDENLQPASVAPPTVAEESHPPPPYPVSEIELFRFSVHWTLVVMCNIFYSPESRSER